MVSAQYTIKDGGPSKREFPKNLLSHGEEDWNKWYEAQAASSVVLIELNRELDFDCMGFKSAGNCPHRDPDSVSVWFERDLSNKKQAKYK